MSKVYAIDIDGTLTVETEGWDYATRTPVLSRIAGVNKLYEEGNVIALFTARYLQDEAITREWLKKYGVKFHTLILGKTKYDVIIDDRALTPDALEFI